MNYKTLFLTTVLVCLALSFETALSDDAFTRGLDAYNKGNYRQAAIEYQRFLRREPGNVQAKLRLAQSYEILGRLQRAIRLANDVLATGPNNIDALLMLGRIHARQENWEVARDFYQRAVQTDPANPSAHLGLGNALTQLGNHTGADAAFAEYRSLTEPAQPK